MELVKGVPITKYCDEHRLTPRQRLELFVPVCQAIQHAHHKGIIHRDVKPSNVLVALYDDKPVPKVIDFGVAKAVGQQLTEQTLHTGFGTVVGTVEYMSPEQASFNQLDVDTRSDVYALGVLLYELLTGSTPLERKRLQKTGLLEALRLIREEEPPTLSNRLGTTAELPAIAANRGTEPAKLMKLVRGELDWIVLKALEKDRGRRYETANAFALDVQRYLADEPVAAGPPSAAYRLRKFARRNKVALLTAALVSLALLLGTLIASWQAVRATQAEGKALDGERQARAAEQKARLEAVISRTVNTFVDEDLLGQANVDMPAGPDQRRGRDVKVGALLDRAAALVDKRFQGQPEVEAAIRLTIGNAYRSLGDYEKAVPQLERAVEIRRRVLGGEHPDTVAALISRARLYALYRLGPLRHAKRESLAREALEASRRVHGDEHPDTLTAQHYLATELEHSMKHAEAEKLYIQVLEARRRLLGAEHRNTLRTRNNLAVLYLRKREYAKCEALAAENLAICRRVLGSEDSLTALARNNLAATYFDSGQYAKAEPLLVEGIAESRRLVGVEHPNTQHAVSNLREIYLNQRQYAKAEPLIIESLTILIPRRDSNRERTFQFMSAMTHLRWLLSERPSLDLLGQKKYAEAEPALRFYANENKFDRTHWPWLTALAQNMLGEALAGQRKYAEAESQLLSGYEGLKSARRKIPIPQRKCLCDAADRIVRLYEAWGKAEQAARWRKKLEQEQGEQKRRREAIAHYQRGFTLGTAGKHAQAEAEFRQAVRLQPDWPEANAALAVTLSNQGKSAEAEAAYQAGLRLQPDNRQLHLRFGKALLAWGKLRQAEAELREAIRLRPRASLRPGGVATINHEDADARDSLAMVFRQQGKWADALAVYKENVRIWTAYLPKSYSQLAWLLTSCPDVKLRKPREGLKAARKAVELAPQSAWDWQVLGWAHYRAGNWKASIEALEKSCALQENPKGGDPGQWFFRAMSHWQLGEKDKARQWYDKATAWLEKEAPDNDELRGFQGEAAELMGMAGLARGRFYAARGQWDKAAADFAAAAGSQPKDAAPLFGIGATYARFGRWDQAAAAYRRGLKLDPRGHWHWYQAAVLYLKAGDSAGYRGACRQLLERFGRDEPPEIAERTAKTCLLVPDGAGRLKAALEVAGRTVRGTEKHGYYWYFQLVQGLAEYRAGRPAAALGWLKRVAPRKERPGPAAAGFAPHDAAAFAVLALAQHRLGRSAEARAALASAREILAEKMPDPAKGRPFGGTWADWLRCQVLVREAEGLLGTKSK
jgi:tetratricopeptide (TPR) repeat protein